MLTAPTAVAAAPGGCVTLTSAPLSAQVVVLDNASQNPVLSVPATGAGNVVAVLTPGTTISASDVFECGVGWATEARAVEYSPGARGYVPAAAVALHVPFKSLVFDRDVVRGPGVVKATIRNAPSASAAEIGSLESGIPYPATTTTYEGSAGLLGSGQFVALDLGAGRAGFVDASWVVTLDPSAAASIVTVEAVVVARGAGLPALTPISTPDATAAEQPLAGRGSQAFVLRPGMILEVVEAGPYRGVQLSVIGTILDALAQEMTEDPRLAELQGQWELARVDDGFVWVPAIAVERDRSLIDAAKEKAQQLADKVEELAAAAKDRVEDKIDERRNDDGAPSILTWVSLIPSGAAALGALLLAGLAAVRRVGWSWPRKVAGHIAVVAGPAVAVTALMWLPGAPPWWAWLAGAGVLLVSALPAGMLVRRLVAGARRPAERDDHSRPLPTSVAATDEPVTAKPEVSDAGW